MTLNNISHFAFFLKYISMVGVCKVLGTNFLPSIVGRGLCAPQLIEGKMAGHGDPGNAI